jgi:hypothetical protein
MCMHAWFYSGGNAYHFYSSSLLVKQNMFLSLSVAKLYIFVHSQHFKPDSIFTNIRTSNLDIKRGKTSPRVTVIVLFLKA